ncbi:MAG TPA: OB-fold domain-containing protein [Myxococcota bacterium]|nr:OB-fold domain-containing protein [Myxococcota bacterium]
MAGIVRYGAYVPFFRIPRTSLGGGKGERAVASYDEDAVSMAVEASREALRGAPEIAQLLLATTSPAYAEKLNAAIVHAALCLPAATAATDVGASTRAGLGALLLGLDLAATGRRTLVAASDVVVGAPEGSRERSGGDAACAYVTGSDAEAIARLVGRASLTDELMDVWRTPEDRFARAWEERFGAEMLTPLLRDAATAALKSAGLQPADLSAIVVDATNERAATALPKLLGVKAEQVADTLALSVGRSGCAAAGLALAHALDRAKPGDRILVVVGADGADAAVLEVTERIAGARPLRSVARWLEAKRNDLPYQSYLKWRGVLPFEPPRRPDPDRPAAPPMHRAERWKYGFVGSRCTACGAANLPPQRVCVACGAVDQMKPEPFADGQCRIATYTLDRLAYSLQPPVIAAVVDFEQGGRMQCELTDVEPSKVAIGDQLEMTFRRLFTVQGVHNYFWKARPKR